jgi:hypothetical protein
MSRKFIAAVLAISTTIAAVSAVPARAASEEDIARLLAGAATVFIIGKAIQNSRDADRRETREAEVRPYVYDHRPNVSNPQITYDRHIPKVVPRDVRRQGAPVLPAECVRRIEGGSVGRVVMGRCLERNSISTKSLPKACRMTVETPRGEARAYALPCLRQRGYTLARY